MALAAATVFEINSLATASNVNGGGFNPANANMLTDLTGTSANTSAPVVASASYNFVAGDVGNWLYIKAGTNWTVGWYKIQSLSGNSAVLEAAVSSANVSQVTNNRYGVNTVIGCATTASPTGGTFTIDYSQSTACITSTAVSDYASNLSSTTMTSATAVFTPVMVGNLFHLNNAGTGAFGVVGWYEIVSYTNATTVVTDRTTNNGTAMVAGQGKIGGALSLGSSDDAVFELAVSSTTASTRYFVKNNSGATYTLGGTVTIAATGNAVWPIILESYTTTRGDRPSTGRATFDCGAVSFTFSTNWDMYSLRFTGTAATIFTGGSASKFFDCKFTNTRTVANGLALNAAANSIYLRCEAISYRGRAVAIGTTSAEFYDCYFHDSDIGVSCTTTSFHMTRCIIADNVTNCFSNITNAVTGIGYFDACTFYGAENKLGTGITFLTASTNIRMRNCIIYGFTTGVTHPDINTIGLDNFNNYFNNTADVSAAANWQKGANDTAVNPNFVSVAQLTGATATTSGSVLTQVGADFSTVTDNVDFLTLISGTGITAGKYKITSHTTTTLTVDIAPGTSATGDKVWQVTTGHNFSPGTSVRELGSPGAFPGALSTSYTDIGAVQRREISLASTFGG